MADHRPIFCTDVAKAVLHTGGEAIVVPASLIPEISAKLYLSLAYEETLGDTTYVHYDVMAMYHPTQCYDA